MTVLLVVSPRPLSTSVVTETAASEELRGITPGESLHREITGGAKDVIKVSATEGTLLRFSIEKGDLVLTAVVYGPTGTKLLEHVSEEFEPVELSVPIDVSGVYIIEIQSREKENTARQYELKLDSLIPITPENRKDSEARQVLAAGGVSRSEWNEASLRQSIENYDKAALIWASLGSFSSASQATLKSGDVHFLLGESAEALSRYQSAATLAAKAIDHLVEAKALIRLGRLSSYTGKHDLAETKLTRALDLLSSIDNTNPLIKNARGEAISNLAEVTYARGDMVKASDQCDQALKLLQGDRKGEAKVHMFRGYIAGSLGVAEKAISEVSEARKLFQATNDQIGEALALTTLGLSFTFKGQPDPAIELQNQAIPIFHRIGDRNNEAIACNSLGQTYEKLKDYETARKYYEQARQIFHDTGALDFEIVTIFTIANIHRLLGNLDRSLALYQLGLQLSRSTGKKRTEMNALSEIAVVYAKQNRTGESRQIYNQLVKFYEDAGDSHGLAITLNAQGEVLLQMGNKAEAAEMFRRALSLSNNVDADTPITTLYNLARAERSLGHLDEALSIIKRSLKKIEELRTNVHSPELRASYFSGAYKTYELGIQTLIDLERAQPGHGYAVEALLMSEQSRARLLVDLIRESEADVRNGAPHDLVVRERELRGLIQNQSQYRLKLEANSKHSSERADVDGQTAKLTTEYQRVQAQIREQNPHALALAQFEPLSFQEIQNELHDNDTMLLEFSLGEEESHLFIVTANSFQYFSLPDRKTLEDASIDVYKLITARQQRDQKLETISYQRQTDESDKLLLQKSALLSQMLFGQIAEQLGGKRLVLITEGILQLVPFDALPAPSIPVNLDAPPRYLLMDHEIDQVPSIATLRAIRASEKKLVDSTDKVAAVIADPVFTMTDDRVKFSSIVSAVASAASRANGQESARPAIESLQRGGGLVRLTHASEEADAIAAAAPRGTTMVVKGFDATREKAMSSPLGEYQILHFATHGFLDDSHPELSAIVLTMVDKNGVEKDGMMPLHDIYSLDLSAELTVLSACQTALGKDIKGEGMVGLTHSFISAGSKSVIASLWKVDDQATSALMADMYQAMLQQGMSPAAALRAAKLKVMQDKRWTAPYFWAGFIVQGEYTNHIAIENNSWRNLSVTVLLSLLLITSGGIFLKRRRHVV